MRVVSILAFLVVWASSVIHAQITVSGLVTDGSGQPLAYANVLLRSTKDSSILKIGYSDPGGHFRVISPGAAPCFPEISFVGMATYRHDRGISEDTNIGTVQLKPVGQISEVTVKAQRPLVEVHADRSILHVEKSIAATAGNSLELLRIAPGVTIGADRQVQIDGKSGVKLYVNDRPAKFALTAIPPSQIARIEVITDPPAKYEAAGNAGIINIILKKAPGEGWTSDFNNTVSYWTRLRDQAGLQGFMKNGKLNLSAGINVRMGTMPQFNSLHRQATNHALDQRIIYDAKTDLPQGGVALQYNAALDYQPNARHKFGLLVSGIAAQSSLDATGKAGLSGTNPDFNILVDSRSTSDTRRWFGNFGAKYSAKLSKRTGLELSADYGRYFRDEQTDQPNAITDGDTTFHLDFSYATPFLVNVYSGGVDLSHQFDKFSIAVGAKKTNVQADNRFEFFRTTSSGNVPDTNQTVRYDYKEQVLAGYVDLSFLISKSIRLSTGLRAEQTHTIGNLSLPLDPIIEFVSTGYDTLNWFPHLTLSWQTSAQDSWRFSFSNRVNRPAYHKLNSFEVRLDPYNGEKGNPRLRPEYAHSIALSWQHGRRLQLKASWTLTDNFIARVEQLSPDSSGSRSYITWANLRDERIAQAGAQYLLPVGRIFLLQSAASVYQKRYRSRPQDSLGIDLSALAFDIKAQGRVRLPHGYGLQILALYQSPTIWEGAFNLDAYWRTDIGITKSVLKGRGMLKLVATDLFHSQKLRLQGQFRNGPSDLRLNALGTSESRQIKLAFSYRFGSAKLKPAKLKQSGLQSEQKRASKQ